MLPSDPIIVGPLTLRPYRLDDVDPIVRACADPDMIRYFPALPSPYTGEMATYWITESVPRTAAAGGAEFAVEEAGEFVGSVALHAPDRLRNHDVGYWVAPWARGRGVARTALRGIVEWAFGQGVERIELLTGVDNLGSQKVAYAAGFRYEGLRRNALRQRDGSRIDIAAFARLATDSGGVLRKGD